MRKRKSRTLRQVMRRTPGGKTVSHYVLRKPRKARCAGCRKPLSIMRERPVKMRNVAKTKKRPQRPFGGVLCSGCMRERIKEMAENV